MLIYIASPYSHPDSAIREKRFRDVCKLAAAMMISGMKVFSPIAHSHPIAEHGELPALDLDFWMAQDKAFLDVCDALVVYTCDGWRESKGIAIEIEYASKIGLPVFYVSEHDNIGQFCMGVRR